MIDALIWFLSIHLLGLLGLPLAFALFSRLPDRGYTLAKPLALILASYILWVLGLTGFIPNSQAAIVGILLVMAVACGFILRTQWRELRRFLIAEHRTIIVSEVVFLAFFLLWLSVVSSAPEINHTEKPMDFAFLNAVLQARHFPPEDPWLAGHSISYYYFGHFAMALLTKLTGIASSISYNLSISLVSALAATAAFGFVYNLVRLSGARRQAAMSYGLLGAVLLVVVGNLEGALEFSHLRGWGGEGFWQWVGMKGLDGVTTGQGLFPDGHLWWWRATRVIDTLSGGQSLDYTITEFPMFSFVLGDLHAHVLSLPFVVLGLALCLNVFMSGDRLGVAWLRHHPVEFLAIALFLGSLAFINAWDFPLLAGVLAVVVLLKSYSQERDNLRKVAWSAVVMLLPVLVLAVVLFLPYYLTLDTQASGVSPWTGPPSRPFLFFIVMGLFFTLGATFALVQLAQLPRPGRRQLPAILSIGVLAVLPLLAWMALVIGNSNSDAGVGANLGTVGSRVFWVLPGIVLVVVAAVSAAQRVHQRGSAVSAFPLLLFSVSVYLLVGVELFYVTDLFGNRMNTVFKVYYQVWLMMAVVGAYGLWFWRSRRTNQAQASRQERQRPMFRIKRRLLQAGRLAWTWALLVLLAASLYYPVGAALDRTGLLHDGHSFADNTLDGLAFVEESMPGEYAAIQWLRDQAPPGRIVEAVGQDYSDYGRISASTGLPTILGWEGHELQWRGSYEPMEGRRADVAAIYQSNDVGEVRRVLERYGVRYIYWGDREKATYGQEHLDEFDTILKTVFRRGRVTIYEYSPINPKGYVHGDGNDQG